MGLDLDDFAQLDLEIKRLLSQVSVACKKILEEEIEALVYNVYEPNTYERTNQLKNSIIYNISEDGSIHLLFDGQKYESYVDDSDQSENVPYYINFGHSDSTGIDNMYHNYPARDFMESAKRRMETELGVKVTILI